MLDWKVTEDDTVFPPDTSDDTPPRRPTWRTWAIVAVVALVVLSVGGYYVYQRVQKSEAVMRQDLFAFIRDEERARQAGMSDRAPHYWFPQTHDEWQAAYQETFRVPPLSQGITVTLDAMEMENDTAYVVVGLGAHQQRRAYQLTQSGWRRTSLFLYDWGETDTLGNIETGSSVTYHASDAAFARQMFEDVPALMPLITSVINSFAPDATIRIEAAELQGALLQAPSGSNFTSLSPSTGTPPLGPDFTVVSTDVVLNSPQVVEVPPYWQISGESAVRYAYAEWASQRMMSRARIVQSMPNYGRFVEATRHVIALRWALSEAEYAAVVERWRTLGTSDGWESPFSPLAVMDARIDSFDPTPMEARMLAVADAVYSEVGGQPLATMVSLAPPTGPGWDDFFLQGTGKRTIDFEMQVRGGPDTADIPALPITGRLVHPTDLSAQLGGLAIQPDGTRTTIALSEIRNAPLQVVTPLASVTVSPACLYLFPQVTVNGSWRDEGIRLSVSELTVTEPFPPFQYQLAPSPARPDPSSYFQYDPAPAFSETVAVVGQNEKDNYFINQFDSLAALSADGTLTTVLTDTTGRLHIALGSGSLQRAGIFLRQEGDFRDCLAAKMTLFTPEAGIIGQWLLAWDASGSVPTWFWDARANQGIVVLTDHSRATPIRFWRLSPGIGTVLTTPDGTIAGGVPYELRPGAEDLVVQRDNPTRYELVHLDTDTVLQSYAVASSFIVMETVFTADGNTLAMVAVDPTQSILRPILWTYDVATTTQIAMPTVLWERQEQLYNVQADFSEPYLYAITSDDTSTQLSVLGDARPRLITSDTATQQFYYHRACRGGGVATLTTETDRPTTGARTLSLFRSDGSLRFRPLALPDTVTLLWC